MRKFLLSAALLSSAFLAANAQYITFQNAEGQLINIGDVVNLTGEWEVSNPANIVDGMAVGYVELKMESGISIVSNQEGGNIIVDAKSLTGTEFEMCFAINCENSKDGVLVQENEIEADTPRNLQLGYRQTFNTYGDEPEPFIVPYLEIYVQAYYDYDPDTIVYFTVKLGDPDAAVKSIASNDNLVKVVGKNLNYDLNGSSSINVYSLSGKTVVSRQVAGNGSISLANLPKGVYIYKVSGKNAKSGKFVIK